MESHNKAPGKRKSFNLSDAETSSKHLSIASSSTAITSTNKKAKSQSNQAAEIKPRKIKWIHYLTFYTQLIKCSSNSTLDGIDNISKFVLNRTVFSQKKSDNDHTPYLVWVDWPTVNGLGRAQPTTPLLFEVNAESDEIYVFLNEEDKQPIVRLMLNDEAGVIEDEGFVETADFTAADLRHLKSLCSQLLDKPAIKTQSKTSTTMDEKTLQANIEQLQDQSVYYRIENIILNNSTPVSGMHKHMFKLTVDGVELEAVFSRTDAEEDKFDSWIFAKQNDLKQICYAGVDITRPVQFHTLALHHGENELLKIWATVDGHFGELYNVRTDASFSGATLQRIYKNFKKILMDDRATIFICDDASFEKTVTPVADEKSAKSVKKTSAAPYIAKVPLRLIQALAGEPSYYEKTLGARLFEQPILSKEKIHVHKEYQQSTAKRKESINKLQKMKLTMWLDELKESNAKFHARLTKLSAQVFPSKSMDKLTIGDLVKSIYTDSKQKNKAGLTTGPTDVLIEVSALLTGADHPNDSLVCYANRGNNDLTKGKVGELVNDILWEHGRIWVYNEKNDGRGTPSPTTFFSKMNLV